LRPELGVRKSWSVRDFWIFASINRKSLTSVSKDSLDFRLQYEVLKVRELTFSSPPKTFEEGRKQGSGLILAHVR
jgi:hypothetical protein